MKKYDAVLFDLDGTLLPMDQDVFIKEYFRELCGYAAPYGYSPELLVKAVWAGTGAMVKNDGSRSNEEAFWQSFSAVCGRDAAEDKPLFDRFYVTAFGSLSRVTTPSDEPRVLIRSIKKAGVPAILASSPIFPMTAHKARVRWAGLDPDDFIYITAYENSTFCKPDPGYYTEITEKLSLDPQKCLMVGNDTGDDLPALSAGMDVFVITDCLIDKNGTDLSSVPHGGMNDMCRFVLEHI